MNVTIIVDRETEHEINVEFEYRRAYRGARDSLGGVRGAGPPLEPDEPASMEFVSATDEDGNDFELTDSELDYAEQRAWDSLD
jgi:hypothetical protein